MKTTKKQRDEFREYGDGSVFLRDDIEVFQEILDDADRCEQLEQVAEQMAVALDGLIAAAGDREWLELDLAISTMDQYNQLMGGVNATQSQRS